MRYLATLLLVVFVGACGTDVPGYSELDNTLVGEEAARKDVFDAAALYEPVQIVLEQVVNDVSVSPSLKESIKTVDREAVGALNDYRAAVAAADGDAVTARLAAFISILGRAQALLLEAQAEGLV